MKKKQPQKLLKVSDSLAVNTNLEIIELSSDQNVKDVWATNSPANEEAMSMYPKNDNTEALITQFNNQPKCDSDLINTCYFDLTDFENQSSYENCIFFKKYFWENLFSVCAYHVLITFDISAFTDIYGLSKLIGLIHDVAQEKIVAPAFVFETEDVLFEQKAIKVFGQERQNSYLRFYAQLDTNSCDTAFKDEKLMISLPIISDISKLNTISEKWREHYPKCCIGYRLAKEHAIDDPAEFVQAIVKLAINEGNIIEDCFLARSFSLADQKLSCGGGIRKISFSKTKLGICKNALSTNNVDISQISPSELYDILKSRDTLEQRILIEANYSECKNNCAAWKLCQGCLFIDCEIMQSIIVELAKHKLNFKEENKYV